MDDTRNAFFAGRCDAWFWDRTSLGAQRLLAPSPNDFVMLPDVASNEPLAPAVLKGDDELSAIVRWTAYVLIIAEAKGSNTAVSATGVSWMEKSWARKRRISRGRDARFRTAKRRRTQCSRTWTASSWSPARLKRRSSAGRGRRSMPRIRSATPSGPA